MLFPQARSLFYVALLVVLLAALMTPSADAAATGATSTLQFLPTDSATYTAPVFVHLQCNGACSSNTSEVLIYVDGHSLGMVYSGPFWIDRSVRLTAVQRSLTTTAAPVVSSASYDLEYASPSVRVFPSPGQYVGGVDVVVLPSSPSTAVSVSVNGAQEVALESFLLPLTVNDTAKDFNLTLTESRLHNNVTDHFLYHVLPAVPPRIITQGVQQEQVVSDDMQLTQPVHLVCLSPLNETIPIIVSGVSQTSFFLSQAGSYSLMCSYNGYHGQRYETTLSVTYTPAALQPPRFTSPVCNATLLKTAVLMELEVPQGSRLELEVSGGSSSFILEDITGTLPEYPSEWKRKMATLVPKEALVNIGAFAIPEASGSFQHYTTSAMGVCSVSFVPLGDTTTSPMYAKTWCDETTALAPSECGATIREAAARCLSFYGSEYVHATLLGPFAKVWVSHLPEAYPNVIQHYERTLRECLGNNQTMPYIDTATQVTTNVENLHVALGWKLVYGSSANITQQAATVRSSFLLEVEGSHAELGTYHLVDRDAPNCDVLGLLPLLETPNSGATENRSAFPLLFASPLPGKFKLCVRFPEDGTGYEVPPTTGKLLTVTSQPWPLFEPSSPCGGPVHSPQSPELKFDITNKAAFPWTHSLFIYSINAGEWHTKALGEAITVPSVSETNPLVVVSASLGENSGVSATCVYYYSPPDASQTKTGFQYNFYQVSRSVVVSLPPATPSNVSEVLFTVNGIFEPSEHIVVEVYQTQTNAQGVESLGTALFTTTATTSTALEHRIALSSVPWGVRNVSALGNEPRVRALINGERVALEPGSMALSTLSLSMEPSSACPSGFRFKNHCVCFGSVNKTAYLCEAIPSVDEPIPVVPSSTAHPSGNSPSPPTAAQRAVPLVIYFVLIATIATYIFYSMFKGSSVTVVVEESHAEAVEVV